ncbi:MAG: hypothetical protein AAGD17_07210 [Bacteroidota bacterium]
MRCLGTKEAPGPLPSAYAPVRDPYGSTGITTFARGTNSQRRHTSQRSVVKAHSDLD